MMYQEQENPGQEAAGAPDLNTTFSSKQPAPVRNPFEGTKGLEVAADHVSFLGVSLPRGNGGPCVPEIERFQHHVLREFDLILMRNIAVGLKLNQAVLIESGSNLGKSDTVERMCALLDRECYDVNCSESEIDTIIGGKTVREDTKSGFGWRDGVVLQAIRSGGVLFLDEFNFMRGEIRGRLLEILDTALRGKSEVVLKENDGERVKVHPDFRLVVAQNPPGAPYRDREVFDPAQYTRFVVLKEPTSMPKGLKEARALGAFNLAPELNLPPSESFEGCTGIGRDVLEKHPELKYVVRQFVEFEHGLDQLLASEKNTLGINQPQPTYLAFQRDYNRLIDFVCTFYNGNLVETFQRGLRYYYENRFETEIDREKVRQLIQCNISGEPKPDPKRKPLGGSPDLNRRPRTNPGGGLDDHLLH